MNRDQIFANLKKQWNLEKENKDKKDLKDYTFRGGKYGNKTFQYVYENDKDNF